MSFLNVVVSDKTMQISSKSDTVFISGREVRSGGAEEGPLLLLRGGGGGSPLQDDGMLKLVFCLTRNYSTNNTLIYIVCAATANKTGCQTACLQSGRCM